jgi:hypothetical protein
MRLEEFASAEDQLNLWKLVSDAVWAGINTQRQQQAQAADLPKDQPKAKTRASAKGAKAKPVKTPVLRVQPKPKTQPQQKPALAAAIAKSKGQVAVPAATPLKPGIAAAQAPSLFGQPAVRAATLPPASPRAPARPLTPLQKWLNRRPWTPPAVVNVNQMPQNHLKSRPFPQN